MTSIVKVPWHTIAIRNRIRRRRWGRDIPNTLSERRRGWENRFGEVMPGNAALYNGDTDATSRKIAQTADCPRDRVRFPGRPAQLAAGAARTGGSITRRRVLI